MHYLLKAQPNTLQILNVASGRGTSVLQLIHAFKIFSGKDILLSIESPRVGDPNSSIGYIDNTKSVLDWAPTFTLNEIVKSSLKTILIS